MADSNLDEELKQAREAAMKRLDELESKKSEKADTASDAKVVKTKSITKSKKKKEKFSLKRLKQNFITIMNDQQFINDRRRTVNMMKSFLLGLFRFIILLGLAFVIVGPLLSMISQSFFTKYDYYNPMVYLFPMQGTTERYEVAIKTMRYFPVLKNLLIYVLILMVLQVVICSMVGYGFARFEFPLKKFLLACVVIMIVLPTHMIMLPLYVTFQNFFGINMLKTTTPMYIMTLFAAGLRSGLYIYIFQTFFRGLPKEIEEAAFVDGAGMWYTYFRIMLVNAMPSVVTVAIFSLVWQYNDTSFVKIFQIPSTVAISTRLGAFTSEINSKLHPDVQSPSLSMLYTYAGAILVMLPVLLVYIVLQKQFVEGVERSGIVG